MPPQNPCRRRRSVMKASRKASFNATSAPRAQGCPRCPPRGGLATPRSTCAWRHRSTGPPRLPQPLLSPHPPHQATPMAGDDRGTGTRLPPSSGAAVGDAVAAVRLPRRRHARGRRATCTRTDPGRAMRQRADTVAARVAQGACGIRTDLHLPCHRGRLGSCDLLQGAPTGIGSEPMHHRRRSSSCSCVRLRNWGEGCVATKTLDSH